MSTTQKRDELLAAAANAPTLQAQMSAVAALAAFDEHQAQAHKTARSLDWSDTVVKQTLSPVAVHERSTLATDWLAEFEPKTAGLAQHEAMAEAAMWFGRTSPEVRADRDEFAEQAKGFMRREASKYGEDMGNVYASGLSYLAMLHKQSASGLDQIQQTVDSHDNPKATPLDPEVFDNFADEVHPINAGVVGTETSERNPLLQEILQEGSGQGQAEVEGGHSTTNEPTGPASQFPGMDAASGPLGTTSVAINQTLTMDDFRRESASSLPQVQQVVDAQENPAPTPLPEEVAFPWLIDDEDEKKEASRAPFGREAAAQKGVALKTAGGDFYKDGEDSHRSWYDHPDYFTHYQHGYDSSGRHGEPRDTLDEDGFPVIHDLSSGEADHLRDHPNAGNGARSAWMDGWVDRSSGNDQNRRNQHQWKQNQASRKQADMFNGADGTHAVPGPSPANNPLTTPDLSAGYQEGLADGQAGERPTFADASSQAPQNVQDYSKGYGDGARGPAGSPAKDVPVSEGGDNGQSAPGLSMGAMRRSASFVVEADRTNTDFAKAYAFASKWKPGQRLVTTGSAKFEAGLYAGLVDAHGINSEAHEAWRAAHRRQARKDSAFADRLDIQDRYTSHLASNGIDVTAATSIDLDTLGPAASPQPNGNTPVNGPGTPPILEGGVDPARPGGPAPYNGAGPVGAPVVPTGPAPAEPGNQYVNDVVGGPLDGNTKGLAFRRSVQAGLLANKKGDSR